MKKTEFDRIRGRVLRLAKRAHIVLTAREKKSLEICDFGLRDIKNIGIQVVTYVNDEHYSAKEIFMLPGQIFPELRHPPSAPGNPGKRETLRCRWGEAFLYTEGKPSRRIRAHIPYQYRDHFTVWKQSILHPGDQSTIPPDTLHWLQAGPKGAVVSLFGSVSADAGDILTDPQLRRTPEGRGGKP